MQSKALTEANPSTTMLSDDGVGAFDSISRSAMLQGSRMPLVVREPSPSSSSFMAARPRICGSMRSRRERAESKATRRCLHCTLWVNTGPSLLCKQFGRHLVVANPHRIAAIYAELESALWNHAGIRINLGKRSCSTGEVSCHLVANTSSKRAGRCSSRDRVAWRPHVPRSPARDCCVGTPLE